MVFCTRCGKQIPEGAVCSCSANASSPQFINREAAQGFWESMKNRMGIGDPERNATDTYERGQKIVPDNINPTEGEIPVKQYNVAVLRRLWFLFPFLIPVERSEGRMQVTNKRLIFRAPGRAIGGRTTLQHEYAIDDVAGLEAQRNFRFSPLHCLCGLLLVVLAVIIGSAIPLWAYSDDSRGFGNFMGFLLWVGGLAPFFLVKKRFLLKLALLGVSLGGLSAISLVNTGYYSTRLDFDTPAVILVILTAIVTFFGLFLYFMRPNLVICIKNKMGVDGGPVNISIKGTLFTEVIPTDESERAIREMGAMINDIQKLGDLGLEKWIAK